VCSSFSANRAFAQSSDPGAGATPSQNRDAPQQGSASAPTSPAAGWLTEPAPTPGEPDVPGGASGSDPASEGAPPPVAFPEGEAPPGEIESTGPSRSASSDDGYDSGGGYSDQALVDGPGPARKWDFTAGLSYSFLKDQLQVGPVIAIGQGGFWLDLGAPLVFTLKSAPEIGGNYLGERFELAFGYAPLDTMKWRARFGIGGDLYTLWGIGAEEAKVALALKADVTYWATKNFGVELGVRGYPLHSEGLSVEKGPGGIPWLPFFFTVTVHYRSPGDHP
jgi:hypothetical protein